MKKALFFAGLAAAALSFSACNKETSVSWLDASPMKVVLNTAETRTTTDGIHTSWADGDKINVIHAEAGTTEYKNDTPYQDGKTYPFVVSDTEAGTFTGKLMGGDLEADKSYDWYFFYPYSSYIVSPVNSSTSGGYAYIGGRSDQSQTQTGNNSKTHLAGGNSAACFPLYGVKKNVPAGEQPAATMKHIASAVAVTVKNETDEPITISQVEFTAPENIVGQFYISFDQETPTFENQKYSAATASLTVKEGTAIAKGATATFYIGIKPFTAKAGDKLSLKITTTAEKVVEKELTLPSSVEFKPGLIKTLNVSFDKGQDVETQSLAEIKELETGADVHTQEVLVVAKYAQGIMLGQEGVYLLAYNKDGVDANVGDIVKVSGKMGAYTNNNNGKSYPQITGPEVTFISGDNPVVLPEPKVLTTLDGYDQIYPELIQYTGTLAVSGSYYNVTVPGSTNVGSIQYPLNPDEVKAFDKKVVTVTGFFVGMSGNKFYVNTMLTSIEESSANAFDVAEREISVPATATSAEIQVTGNVDWTVHPEDGILSATPLSGTGEGTVTVTFAANTDTEVGKEYTVHIRTEATGVEDEIEVIISQAKADPEGLTTATVDFSAQDYANQTEMKEVTINGVTVTFDKGTNSNAPKYYTSGTAVRMYGSNSMTVTVASGTRAAALKTIKSIEITFGDSDGTNPITTDVPTYEDGTWTGEAGSVTFTIGGTTGNRRIKALTVTYSDEAAPSATLVSIAVSGMTTAYTVGDKFSFDGTVTATYDNGDEKTVTPTEVSDPDMSTAGEKTVIVTYTEGGVTKEATYTITVSPSDENTLSKTMGEVVEANEYELSSGNDNIHLYTTVPLNASVRMSTSGKPNCGAFYTDETYGAQWRLYEGSAGDVTFSVAEGCALKSVKIRYSNSNNGRLYDGESEIKNNTKYDVSGSSVTYTVGHSSGDKNGQVRITEVEIVYTGEGTFPDDPTPGPTEIETKITLASSAAVYVGATYSLNATSNVPGATITYESEDTAIATVDANGVVTGVAEGTVKVYARITGVPGEYTDAERYCNVTVSTKPVEEEGTELITFSELGYANGAEVATVEGTNFTMVFAKGEGSYAPKYYDAGTNVRIYKNNTLTISSDKTITKIEFLCTKDYDVHSEAVFSTGSCSDNIWTGSAKSVEMLNGTSETTQIRLTGIKVTFE